MASEEACSLPFLQVKGTYLLNSKLSLISSPKAYTRDIAKLDTPEP